MIDEKLTKKFKEHTLETGWYKFINDCGNLDKWCVGIVERVEFDPEIEELLERSY